MIKNLELSLTDLAGAEYMDKVCRASARFGLKDLEELQKIAEEKIEFFPDAFARQLDSFIPQTGSAFSEPLPQSSPGAGTAAFNGAFHRENAPLTGLGCFRVGEDGKLAVIGKKASGIAY